MDNKDMTTNLEQLQSVLTSGATSKSMAMLNAVMVETLGMSMHNAVTAQHNAQQVNTAATTSTCARILTTFAVAPPDKESKNKGIASSAANVAMAAEQVAADITNTLESWNSLNSEVQKLTSTDHPDPVPDIKASVQTLGTKLTDLSQSIPYIKANISVSNMNEALSLAETAQTGLSDAQSSLSTIDKSLSELTASASVTAAQQQSTALGSAVSTAQKSVNQLIADINTAIKSLSELKFSSQNNNN